MQKHWLPFLIMLSLLTGCRESEVTTETQAAVSSATPVTSSTSAAAVESSASGTATSAAADRPLVVYFSRTGEQYGVGEISEGNTAIVADIIADKVGADKFEIVPVNDYPYDLQSLFDVAKKEQTEHARPDYVGDVENWDAITAVYIGYPLWFDDMPMIVYHFLEDHDFSGKTVYPFDTCGSEGLLETVDSIRSICIGADVRDGLSVRGVTVQNQRDEAEKAVDSWLKENGVLP